MTAPVQFTQRSYEETSRLLSGALEETPDETEAPAEGPEGEKKGGIRRALGTLTAIPRAIGRGAVNAVDDTAETLLALGARVAGKRGRAAQDFAEEATGFIDHTRDAIFGRRSESGVVSFVEDTAQFVTGFVGAGKIRVFGRALNTLRPVIGGAARGAIVDFAMFDPYKAQLAELAASWEKGGGVRELGEMLSVSEDAGVVESRFKRAAGGLIPGVAIDGLIASARLFRNIDVLRNPDATPAAREAAQVAVEDAQRTLDNIEAGTHVTDEPVQVKPAEDGAWRVEGEGVEPVAYPTRPEAERAAAVVNEALAQRTTAKRVELSPEETTDILESARLIREAGDDPEKLIDAFGRVRFNLGNMDIPERQSALLRAVSDALDPVFERTQGRPSISLDESVQRTMKLAGMITADEADEYLKGVGNVLKNADANLLLMNAKIGSHAEAVVKWSRILDEAGTDEVALREARIALQRYIDLAADVSGSNSGVGRGLNALKARGDDALKELKHKDPVAPKGKSEGTPVAPDGKPKAEPQPDIVAGMTAAELKEVMRLFRITKDHRVLFDTLASEIAPAQTLGGKIGRGMLEFFYNSVLSHPATHGAIFVANGLTSSLEDSVRLLAGVLKRDPEMIRGATDLIQGRIIYGKQSIQGMVAAYKAGHSIIDPKPIYKAIPGLPGEVVRTMGSRPMAAMDEFWRVNNNLAYVRMRSLQIARREAAAQGLKGKEYDRFISERVEADVRASIDPASGASRLPEARGFAALPTFSSPLREGSFGDKLEKLVQDHPVLVPIMPFVRTSLNVLDYTFAKSSPLGLFTKQFREAMARGGEEAAITSTRMAVGTTLWGTAGLMAFGGAITGKGPSDPKLRKMWLADNQPYSVKINGHWVSYRRAEPFASQLSIMADLAQMLRDNSDDLETQEQGSKVFYGMVAATVSGLTNKTYLTGLVDFMDAIGSGSPSRVKNFVDGLVSPLVPNVAQAFNSDPYLRETQGMFDALVNRVPGWSQTLPARYNAFGEPVALNPGRQQRSINPFPVREATAGTESELLELNRAFVAPPTTERFGNRVVNLHDRRYQVADGKNQTPYERFMEIVRDQDLRGQVEKVMASPAYERAGDGTEVFEGGRRYQLVRDKVQRVYDRARRQMLRDYPTLARELKGLDRARRASQRNDARGESILEQLR